MENISMRQTMIRYRQFADQNAALSLMAIIRLVSGKMREPVNGTTHLAGFLFSIGGLIALVVAALHEGTVWHVVAFSIFGISMILLYASSTLHHSLQLSKRGSLLFERIDHIMIFVLIAGTYTPFCLVPLRGAWGWSMLGAIWGLALAGTLFKIFWMHAPRWLSTAIYLLMGWIVVVAIYPLALSIPVGAMTWLVLGGAYVQPRCGDIRLPVAGPISTGFWLPRNLAFVCPQRQLLPFLGDIQLCDLYRLGIFCTVSDGLLP